MDRKHKSMILRIVLICQIWTLCILNPCAGQQPVPAISTRTPQEPIQRLAESWQSTGSVDWHVAAILGLLSKSAYEDDKELMGFLATGMGFERCETIQVKNSFAHALVGNNVVVIAFRGTEFTSLKDWKTDAYAKFLPVPGIGRMHTGFHVAYHDVRKGVETIIRNNPNKKVWLTGHSLGGAMAVVCGIYLNKTGLAKPHVITFGQPRVGDNSTAKWIDKNMPNSYQRIVNDQDIVPTLPPTIYFQYADAGRYVLIGQPGIVGSSGPLDGLLGNKILTTAKPRLASPMAFPVVGGESSPTPQDPDSPEEVYQSPTARLPLTREKLDQLIRQEDQLRTQSDQKSIFFPSEKESVAPLAIPMALGEGSRPVSGFSNWFSRDFITDHFMSGYLDLIRSERDR